MVETVESKLSEWIKNKSRQLKPYIHHHMVTYNIVNKESLRMNNNTNRNSKIMIKKTIYIMLVLSLMFTMVGCNKNNNVDKDFSNNIQQYIDTNIKEYYESFVASRDEIGKSMKDEMMSTYGENHEITGEFDSSLAATCSNGTFVGKENGDGIITWKGVPYAKQPIGDLRFKVAQQAEESNKIFEAYYFGHSSIQFENVDEASSYYPQGEDCLNISIWNNSNDDSSSKPVMIFIHGGAYIQGGSCEPTYDLTNFVINNPEVLVASIDYRTSILGFINLSNVPGDNEYKYTPNLGLLDIVEGLKWVKKNIAAFGGDPESVTVFGESAGSGIISALTIMPQAKGLINRAIMESGTSTGFLRSKQESLAYTEKILEITKAQTIDDLLCLTDDDLRKIMEIIYLEYPMGFTYPELDGVVLPEDINSVLESDTRNGIDILIGTNKDEMKYFSYFAGKEAMQAVYQTKLDTINAQASKEELERLQAFFDSVDGDIYEKYEKFINYYMFHTPSLFEAKTHADNNQNVYMYYFTEESTIPELKSAHGFELRYVFGNLNDLAASEEPANSTLSAIMQKSFVNFAKTGNPSILENQVEGISSLEWKKYKPDDYQVMILNSNNPHLEIDPLNERNEIVKDLMDYIR